MLLDPRIYSNNIAVLKRCHPDLYRLLEQSPPNQRFEIIPTDMEGIYNIRDKIKQVDYYNSHNPIADVESALLSLKLRNTRIALFLGMGLGYEILYYVNRMLKQQSTNFLIIVERELEIFKAALQTVNLAVILENPAVKLFIAQNDNQLFASFYDCLMADRKIVLIKTVNSVYHPSALIINQAYYQGVIKLLEDAAQLLIDSYGNSPLDTMVGIEHMLANLQEIVNNPGINLLFDKFKGKPGFVVASGPSLSKNGHLLKQIENKALIVCANSTLRLLINMGVKPNLVAVLERFPAVVKLLDGFRREDVEEVYCVACPVIPPEAFAAYAGPRIITYRDYPQFDWLEVDRGNIKIQYSSGNMAFKIAQILGCDPIVLVGQDLAFSPQGHTHAYGNPGTEDGKAEYVFTGGGNLIEVKGNNEPTVLTNQAWYQCIRGYELDIAACNCTVINSTEGGAYIKGTQLKPLQESITKYAGAPFFPQRIIKESLQGFQGEKCRDELLQIAVKLDATINNIEKVISLCRQGEDYSQQRERCLEELVKRGLDLREFINQIPLFQERVASFKNEIFQEQNIRDIFSQVVQPYDLTHYINLFAIPNQFFNAVEADREAIRLETAWFELVLELAKVCHQSLLGARKKIRN